MKNIPRIFIDAPLAPGAIVSVASDVVHYLTRVMRRSDCLVFGGGAEYNARLTDDGKKLLIGEQTAHTDPSNDVTLYFAPIKRTDDIINMATQMGVAKLVPVITERTVAHHINWDRMRKIAIEAAEQSNRNSVPDIAAPIKFDDLDKSGLVYGDERAAAGRDIAGANRATRVLIGPEGGFSDAEFDALHAAGAVPVSLGRTILRAEVAAVVILSRMILGEA